MGQKKTRPASVNSTTKITVIWLKRAQNLCTTLCKWTRACSAEGAQGDAGLIHTGLDKTQRGRCSATFWEVLRPILVTTSEKMAFRVWWPIIREKMSQCLLTIWSYEKIRSCIDKTVHFYYNAISKCVSGHSASKKLLWPRPWPYWLLTKLQCHASSASYV